MIDPLVPDRPPHDPLLPHDGAADADEPVFLEHVTRYLDNTLTADAAEELTKQLENDPAKRTVFARICLVDTLARERLAIQPSDFVHLDDDETAAKPVSGEAGSLHDAIAFPAIHLEVEPEEPAIQLPAVEEPDQRLTRPANRLRRWGYAAAVLLALGTTIVLILRLAAPNVATIEALSDAQWEGDDASTLTAHALIRSGRSLSLVRGCASLRFTGGTEVIIEAPRASQSSPPRQFRWPAGSWRSSWRRGAADSP